MNKIEVELAGGSKQYFQAANQQESHFVVLHPDGSLSVHVIDQPGDGSPPTFDEEVARYDAEDFVGWTES